MHGQRFALEYASLRLVKMDNPVFQALEMLGRANGVEFRKLKHKGMRKGCHCIESRDIGAYETCPNGCRYCYANKSHDRAAANYRMHDPKSPILIGTIKDSDIIINGDQESFLEKGKRVGQVTFDDL